MSDEAEQVEDLEATEESAPPKRSVRAAPKTLSVLLIKQVGKAAVVRYQDEDGDYHKSTVPTSEITDGKASEKVLQAGDDGFQWEDHGLATDWSKALREAGIYDPEDYAKRPRAAQQALLRAAGAVIGDAIRHARS